MADNRDFIYVVTSFLSDPDFGLQPEMTGSELRELWGAWLFFMLFIAEHGRNAGINYEKLLAGWMQKFGTSDQEKRNFEKLLETFRTNGQLTRIRDSVRIRNFNIIQGTFKKRFRKKPKQTNKGKEEKERKQTESDGIDTTNELAERMARRVGSAAFAITAQALISEHGYDLVNTADRNLEEAMRGGAIRNPAGFLVAEIAKLKGG